MFKKLSMFSFVFGIVFSLFTMHPYQGFSWAGVKKGNFEEEKRNGKIRIPPLILSVDQITRRIRSRDLIFNGVSKESIEKILNTINKEFLSHESNQAQDILSKLSMKLIDLNLDLKYFFSSIAIQTIEAAGNEIVELRANSGAVIYLAEYLTQKVGENSEDTLKSLVSDAFETSKKIPQEFRNNMEALKKTLGNRLEKFEVDFKLLKVISNYSAKNAAQSPNEYRRNLGYIGEILIGGLRGERETTGGRVNEIGERFAQLEKEKRPNPEDFLSEYLPLIDKNSGSIPGEFRSNLTKLAHNTADLLLNHIAPEPIINVAFTFAAKFTSSPEGESFRSAFWRICSRAISLEIKDSDVLLPVMEEIISVSEGNPKFFDRNVGAVGSFKSMLLEEKLSVEEVLLPLVKAAAMTFGGTGAQFRINLGEEEGIGHLVLELKRKGLSSKEIESILIKKIPKTADDAVKETVGRKRAVRFRELLRQIIDEYI